ncbi:uncharacterized protein LOC125832463 [Solanum verrucosum]|uniref:uncharacterized protein LOC125832463 n=1 Tax=Solanum verrucosum TaxID=315347 RepID=UPI0020D1C861|nr:uncharacterized protein LOC125832463 [Solanum verrucosum]XP_049393585.1 uncharacterized protein LOC125857967 [Solanum stenotomum]
MANRGSDNFHSSIQVPGQAQMRREDLLNQPSDIHNQSQATNLLQETGTQVKNMAQGAAGSAVNIARGAATGAANMAQGAADAVKNTLGMNPPHNTSSDNYLNQPGTINFDDDFPTSTTTLPGNTNYPINPHNPNTGI